MKKLRYFLEAAGVYLLFVFFRLLPLNLASRFGGALVGFVGMRMGATRKAKKRLQRVLPNKTDEEYDLILHGMWENIGRVFAEYPHLKTIGKERVQIEGEDILAQHISGNPAIIFGIHAANWELAAPTLLQQKDQEIHITYRAPNNPWVDRLLWKARTLNGRVTAFPKSRDSGRKIISSLKKNIPIGILIDQKYNEGIPVPFMGHHAMTNPVFVQLAQRFKCPLLPARCVRIPGKQVTFSLRFYEPIKHLDDDDNAIPLEDVIKDAHLMIEEWIKEDPAAWLWLHDRWGSERCKELDNEQL